MYPKHHFIISLIISLLFLVTTGSVLGASLCFIFGFLIDGDHLIDYLINEKKFPKVSDFFEYFYDRKYTKIRVFLHSIELIPVYFFVGKFLFGLLPAYGILIGAVSHLTCDYIYNNVRPLTYFLTYRIAVKFDKSRVSKDLD